MVYGVTAEAGEVVADLEDGVADLGDAPGDVGEAWNSLKQFFFSVRQRATWQTLHIHLDRCMSALLEQNLQLIRCLTNTGQCNLVMSHRRLSDGQLVLCPLLGVTKGSGVLRSVLIGLVL